MERKYSLQLLVLLSLLISCLLPNISYATIQLPVPTIPCLDGTRPAYPGSQLCLRDGTSYSRGQNFGTLNNGEGAPQFSNAHVPANGYYVFVYYACYGNSHSCSRKQGVSVFSSRRVYLYATSKLDDQYDSVYGTFRMPYDGGICITLISPDGKEYAPKGSGWFCQDVVELPSTPPANSKCTFNSDNELNVSLGSLERSEIATNAQSGPSVSKTFPVVCTGDKAHSFYMSFMYTPGSIGGQEIVSSSTSGLGVAILYGGKVMGPKNWSRVDFLSGSNSLTLEFRAVRDSNERLIKTGDFKANAVMVMEEL